MEETVIRDVETDPKGRTLVTIEETAETVSIPPRCAGCLKEPTKRRAIPGYDWLAFPWCDACVAPRTGSEAGRTMTRVGLLVLAVALAMFVSLWLGVLGLLILFTFRKPAGGKAVQLMVSESDTVRLAFENQEYARLLVEANQPGEPPR